MINAVTNDVIIVHKIIGKDCKPVLKITFKFSPNPKRITAYCNIFLDVNFIPPEKIPFSLKNIATSIPSSIAITAPPIMGNSFPKIHDGIAIKRHNPMPGAFFLKKFIHFSPNLTFDGIIL